MMLTARSPQLWVQTWWRRYHVYTVEVVAQGNDATVTYDKMVTTVKAVSVTKDGKVLTVTSQLPEDTESNNTGHHRLLQHHRPDLNSTNLPTPPPSTQWFHQWHHQLHPEALGTSTLKQAMVRPWQLWPLRNLVAAGLGLAETQKKTKIVHRLNPLNIVS